MYGPLTVRDWLQLPQLASDPDTTNWGATEKGRTWFNTASGVTKYWDGAAIQVAASEAFAVEDENVILAQQVFS